MIVSQNSGIIYEPIPAGTHAAVCCWLVGVGTHPFTYKGELKEPKKVLIGWELPGCKRVFREEDGEQSSVHSEEYTLSLAEKSNLYKALIQWRGRAFTKEELQGFELGNVLGKPAKLMLIHEPGKQDPTKTYANIAAIQPLGETPIEPATIDPIYFDVDDPDMDAFGKLPQWIQNKIQESKEWQAREGGTVTTNGTQTTTDLDDQPDVPF